MNDITNSPSIMQELHDGGMGFNYPANYLSLQQQQQKWRERVEQV
jgi:predicted translin family RNA/ssDNA-binding protein